MLQEVPLAELADQQAVVLLLLFHFLLLLVQALLPLPQKTKTKKHVSAKVRRHIFLPGYHTFSTLSLQRVRDNQ